MRRIVINWLVLITIAAAVPEGRNKRHLSYIKNFILSTFFGDDPNPPPETSISKPDPQYELYRIPGYNDILIKTLKCTPEELTIVDKSGEEKIKINPFESYIGTKSVTDTDVAFRNVYRLLSTEILNPPESNILQNVMVPIMHDLSYVAGKNIKRSRVNPVTIQSVIINEGDVQKLPIQKSGNFQSVKNIQTFSVTSESIKPRIVDEININGFNNNLQEQFATIYYSQPLKKKEAVMGFTAKRYPDITNGQNILSTSNIPRFINRRLHKVYLGSNPYRTSKAEDNRSIYGVNKYIPAHSKHFSVQISPKLMPLDSLVLSPSYFKKPVQIDVVNTDKYNKITNDDNIILKWLEPTPNDLLIYANVSTVSKEEHKNCKSNNSKVRSTDKIINSVHNAPNDRIFPQVNHTDSNDFDIVKEKDDFNNDTNLVSSLPIENIVTTTTTLTVSPSESNLEATKDNNNGSNVIENSDEFSKSETLSQYIYDHIDHKPSTVKVLKEKEELHTDFVNDTLLPKEYTSVLSIANNTSMNVHNSKVHAVNIKDKYDIQPIKTADNISKDKTLSQYIYKHTNLDDFGKKTKDKSNTSIDNNLPVHSHFFHNSTKANLGQTNDGVAKTNYSHTKVVKTDINLVKNNSKNVNIVQTSDKNLLENNDSHLNIVHANSNDSHKNLVNSNDSLVNLEELDSANLSQLVNKQISYKNFNISNIFEQENQLKANVHTKSPLNQEAPSMSPVIDKGLNVKVVNIPKITNNNQNISSIVQDINEVKTNVVTNSLLPNYADYVPPITYSSPVNYTVDRNGGDSEILNPENTINVYSNELPQQKQKNNQISSKDNPIVLAKDTYEYHKNNVSENEDSDSDRANEDLRKDRGDIPDQ